MTIQQRHFVNTQDESFETLSRILERAAILKKTRQDPQALKGKSVALIFFNPSLRTRSSMQVAVYALGGLAVPMEAGKDTWPMEWADGVVMDQAAVEHIKDATKVLSRYFQAVGVRSFPDGRDWNEDRLDPVIQAFTRYSDVPIINLESALYHPCQAMADLQTLLEKLGPLKEKKVTLTWAYHPKALPMAVPNSFALATSRFAMDLTIACPPGFDLAPEILDQIRANAREGGGRFRVVHDMAEGAEDAEALYAKSWGSLAFYGRQAEGQAAKEKFKAWRVTPDLMRRTAKGIFMHCLPIRRNVIADDEVVDSPASVIYDQAENRLWAQKAILLDLLSA